MTVRAMKSGAVEFLTKPFRDQDLLDAINQALDRDRVARQQQSDLADLVSKYRQYKQVKQNLDEARLMLNEPDAEMRDALGAEPFDRLSK